MYIHDKSLIVVEVDDHTHHLTSDNVDDVHMFVQLKMLNA